MMLIKGTNVTYDDNTSHELRVGDSVEIAVMLIT